MKIKFFFVLLLIAIGSECYGQSDKTDTIPSHWNLTYSPSALANTFSGLQFGVERYFSDVGGLELEGAYIFPTAGTHELSKSGIRGKLGFKMKTNSRLIFLLTIYYRRTVHEHDEQVARFDFSYFERMKFQKTKTLLGPTFGLGTVQPVNDRLTFEGGMNVGFGNYRVKSIGLPDDAEEVDFNWFGYQDAGSYGYLILGLSIKLKYRLGRLTENDAGSRR